MTQIFFDTVSVDDNVDDTLYYNDNSTQYSTDLSRNGLPRYEEVQIRFNNILQKRDQLEENLTGSQIAYLLDFYVERMFDLLEWESSEISQQIEEEYVRICRGLLKNRRKLFSIRFTNEEVYDTLVELFFEKNSAAFKNRFLSIKLNREMYLDFLDGVDKRGVFSDELTKEYFLFYRNQYRELKNLLLGNYIRYSFTETNKFFAYYKDKMPLESKEDYFSGLMLVILKVIDKYDSFKGTLTSFIENWFKDYRTTFRARQIQVDSHLNIEDEAFLNEYSLEAESTDDIVVAKADLKRKFLEELMLSCGEDLDSLKKILLSNKKHFPNLQKLLLETSEV